MAQIRIELNEEELQRLGRRAASHAEDIEGEEDVENILDFIAQVSAVGEEIQEWAVQARRLLAAQLAAA